MKAIFSKLGIQDKDSFLRFVLQFIKFGVVGVSNMVVQLVFYYLCLHWGANHYIANLVGFVFSVANAYIWNSLWVFRGHSTSNRKLRIVQFFSIYIFTFLLSNLFLFLFVDVLKISDRIVPIIIICINTPINFLLSKLWAFRQYKNPRKERQYE